MIDWFYVFAAVTLVGAGVVCFAQSLMRGAMGLLAVMMGLAGFYVRLHAEFLGVVQLLLMAGGFVTALVVAIVLTRKTRVQAERQPALRWGEIFVGVFLGALVASTLVLLVINAGFAVGDGGVGVGRVWDLGKLMLTNGYVLVMMLLGVLMGAAVMGGAYMLRTRRIVEPTEPEIGIPAAPVMGRRR